MASSAVLVFARNPSVGKTRLAKDVGRGLATKVASALLQHTLQNIVSAPVSTRYLYWQGCADSATKTLARLSGCYLRPQEGQNLGQRMQNALKESLSIHAKALLIGTDCPDLTCSIIHDALIKLDSAPICFVPTGDGGFSLIGAHRSAIEFFPILFTGVQWGSDSVMTSILKNLHSADIPCTLTSELRDLDNGIDLIALSQKHTFLKWSIFRGSAVNK